MVLTNYCNKLLHQYNPNTHSINCIPPFHSVPPPFPWNCCMLIPLPISHEIMDGFWCSRCLNDRIKVPDMMRFFVGGALTPLVVEIWTKQPKVEIIPLSLIKSSPVDKFWHLKCLYDHINQPDMIGLFTSSANASLVAKIGTKDLATSC